MKQMFSLIGAMLATLASNMAQSLGGASMPKTHAESKTKQVGSIGGYRKRFRISPRAQQRAARSRANVRARSSKRRG